MSNFKDFLNEKGLIPQLMNRYGISSEDNDVKDFICTMIESISEIDSCKVVHQNLDLDAMAKSYEKIIPHSQRKSMGEFFTPIHVVDYILKSIGYTDQHDIENKKLMDLSCGSGSFLTRAVKTLVERLSPSFHQPREIIKKVKDNIFGIDINPIACVLCQINIYFTLFDLFWRILEDDNNYRIPIFNIFNKDTLQYDFSRKYDFVVGNPPYLFIRAIPQDNRSFIEELPLETNKGQYDYYQIYIELGVKTLKENGKLGYIVPDSLLALSNRKVLRKFIYESTIIKEIYYSGPQFDAPVVSNIILILEKESEVLKRKKNKIIVKFPLSHINNENKIPQYLIKQWDYEFLINLNEDDIRILDHLNNSFLKLEDLIESSDFNIKLSRGVELGKEGEVIYCETCQKYYPLPNKELYCPECRIALNRNCIERIVLEKIPNGLEPQFKPFIYSMNRYNVNELKYINTTKNGINYKDLDLYKDRIVIRQISQGNMICAMYVDSALTSQSYYNLKILNSPNLEFNHEYLLGLLNSKLLSYFFIKSFGSYKKLFPRILIERLRLLPIKVPKSTSERLLAHRLMKNTKEILKHSRVGEKGIDNLQKISDSLIFELYVIDDNDIRYINKFIKNLRNN